MSHVLLQVFTVPSALLALFWFAETSLQFLPDMTGGDMSGVSMYDNADKSSSVMPPEFDLDTVHSSDETS